MRESVGIYIYTYNLLNNFKDASHYFNLSQLCGDSSPNLVCNEINRKYSVKFAWLLIRCCH